jgi:hypothetical protein
MAGSNYEEYLNSLKNKYGYSGEESQAQDSSAASTGTGTSAYEEYRNSLQHKYGYGQQRQEEYDELERYDRDVVQKYYTDYDAFLDTASGIDALTWEQGMQGSGYLQPQLDTLATTDKEIRQWLIDNKDVLGDEYYNQTMRNLNSIGAQNADLTRAYDENVEFWSQFDSQEGYDNYLAGQERAAQLEGVDIAATEAELDRLRQELASREEAMYSRSMVDEGTAGNYDAFAQESRDFAAWQQEQLNRIAELEDLLRDAKDYQGYNQTLIDQQMAAFSTWAPDEQEALRWWLKNRPGGEQDYLNVISGTPLSLEETAAGYGGYNALVYYAAIRQIPEERYESAKMDGAGTLACFRYITLPALRPAFPTVLLLSVLNSYKVYREAFQIGGYYPNDSIYLIQHYIHNNFLNMNYTRLCCISVLLLCVGIGAAIICGILYRAGEGANET